MALLIHDFSSHILSQGTGFATAAPVSAGTAGRGMHVRSGWEQSTNGEGTLQLGTGRPGCLEQPEQRRQLPPSTAKTTKIIYGSNSAFSVLAVQVTNYS